MSKIWKLWGNLINASETELNLMVCSTLLGDMSYFKSTTKQLVRRSFSSEEATENVYINNRLLLVACRKMFFCGKTSQHGIWLNLSWGIKELICSHQSVVMELFAEIVVKYKLKPDEDVKAFI